MYDGGVRESGSFILEVALISKTVYYSNMTTFTRPEQEAPCLLSVPHSAHRWDTEDRVQLRHLCGGTTVLTAEPRKQAPRIPRVIYRGRDLSLLS